MLRLACSLSLSLSLYLINLEQPNTLNAIGFTHSTFAFQQESSIHTRDYQFSFSSAAGSSRYSHHHHRPDEIRGSKVPPGALITLLQKALQYIEIETHTLEVWNL